MMIWHLHLLVWAAPITMKEIFKPHSITLLLEVLLSEVDYEKDNIYLGVSLFRFQDVTDVLMTLNWCNKSSLHLGLFSRFRAFMLNVAAPTPVQPDAPTDKQTIDSLRALQLHGLGLLAQRVRVCQCMCHRQVKQWLKNAMQTFATLQILVFDFWALIHTHKGRFSYSFTLPLIPCEEALASGGITGEQF